MLPSVPNPKTGFLESSKLAGFDSERKERLLALAMEAAEAKHMPDVPALCKLIGIGNTTFYRHLQTDEMFSQAWETVLDRCEATLLDVMYEHGQKPSGYMDRITWLRAHRPAKWNPDFKLRITGDLDNAKGLFDGAKQVFDAELVGKSEDLPAIALRPEEKP